MKTLDMMLLYYDNASILKNWFYRLINHSDFHEFKNRCQIFISDSGTPWEKIQDSLDVCAQQPDWIKEILTYVRCETEEIRKKVPEGISARPGCHAKNVIALDLSLADVFMTSNVGHIFTPDYFKGHIYQHLKDEKAVVLPKRYDLISDTYHETDYQKPWDEIIKGNMQHSGGWLDMSVRRKYIVEVGGFDEEYITIAPEDMDMGSRLTGKLDNGAPSEMLYPYKGKFQNLGLNFHQPFESTFFSLLCNTYKGHISKEDPLRQKGYEIGIQHYLKMWGVINRNKDRKPIQHKILEF